MGLDRGRSNCQHGLDYDGRWRLYSCCLLSHWATLKEVHIIITLKVKLKEVKLKEVKLKEVKLKVENQRVAQTTSIFYHVTP